MKKLNLSIEILILLLASFLSAGGQTTYSSIPSTNIYTSCNTSDIENNSCTTQTFLGGIIRFQLEEINASDFVFKVIKCDDTNFSASGTAYIKTEGVCGNLEVQEEFVANSSFIQILMPIPDDFYSGTRTYYLTLNSVSGDRFHGASIDITAVSPPAHVEFTSCISAPDVITKGDDITFSYSVNAVNGQWNGELRTILGNSQQDEELFSPFVILTPSDPDENINYTTEVDLPSGNYKLVVIADETGQSNVDCVRANGCNDTQSCGSSAITTHYKDVVILPPCSDDRTITVTSPSENAYFTGGFVSIEWEGSSLGDDCPVRIYYYLGSDPSTHIIISESTEDDGIHLWSINEVNLGQNDVYIHVEYITPDDNNEMVGGTSEPFIISTQLDQPVLISPQNNTLFNQGIDEVVFNWNKMNLDGVAEYEFRLFDITSNTLLRDYLNVDDSDTYTETSSSNLIAGHQYRWVVRATNGAGLYEESGINYFEIGEFGIVLSNPIGFRDENNSSVNTMYEGETYTFESEIENLGQAEWQGSLYLIIDDFSIPVDLGSFTVGAGQTTPISVQYIPAENHTGIDIPIEVRYQTNGEGNSYNLGSLFFENPEIFTIYGKDLEWVTPNGGEVFEAGEYIPSFLWNSIGNIPYVSIDLVSSSTVVANIAFNITNNGSYSTAYLIPENTPTGQYRLKLYNYPAETIIAFTEELSINNSGSYELVMESKIDAEPSPLRVNVPSNISASIKNLGEEDFSGNVRMRLIDPNESSFTLFTAENITIADGTGVFPMSSNYSFDNDIEGSYEVIVEFQDVTESNPNLWYAVNSTTNIPNPQDFNVLDPSGQCNITNPPYSENEAYIAAQYLCGLGVIQEPNEELVGDLLPDDPIRKEDIAKVVFYALYDFDASSPSPADNFPVPFGDMQQQENQSYARYGKVLSYLEYGDGISPFSRDFFNYRPGSLLTRGEVAKVFIEAFNLPKDNFFNPYSDVPTSHPYFIQIANLADLGIVNSASLTFRPDDIATRIEVFIMLYRVLELCSECDIQKPAEDDFFDPGNYTPANLGNHPGIADANFDQYSKTSFNIPARNLPLAFAHNYNSYLTELQDELFCVNNSNDEWISFRPLGHGWSHTYNSYIQKIPGFSYPAYGLFQPDRYVVFWPNGRMHIYEGTPDELVVSTEGVYDQIAYSSDDDAFTITKKNQLKYTYAQRNTVIENWPFVLVKVEDRNGNTLTLSYEEFQGGGIRLKYVTGPAGRKLSFGYSDASNKIISVTDPASRKIKFQYGGTKGEDLIKYWDAEDFLTTYNYGLSLEEEHLLKVIKLPNGNYVSNTYEERKLQASKTNSALNQSISDQSINWNLGTSPLARTTSTVTTNDGTNTYEYSYVHNDKGKVVSLSTPTNQLDVTEYNDPMHPTLPTKVTIDGISTEYQYDEMGNVTQIDKPLSVSHKFIYNGLNDVESYINPRNYETTFTYDGVGNVEYINTPIGSTYFEYNDFGQIRKVTNPEDIYSEIQYDNYGNPILTSTAEGISSSSSYDIIGRVKSHTDPNDQVISYDYDNRDFVKKVIDPMNYITQYNYDGNGNLTSVTNTKGNSTTLEYDYFDWLKSMTFGDLTKSFDYDEDGKVRQTVKPDGTKIKYLYDTKGNLIDNDYATFSYDLKNRIKTVEKDNKKLEYYYDEMHRIIRTSYDNFNVDYEYDLNSNLKQITYPGDKVVVYTYDEKDRLKTVKDWNQNVTAYNYLADDRLESVSYPNNVVTEYSYDDAARMTAIVTKVGNDILVENEFEMDFVGNHVVEKKNELFTSNSFEPLSATASYDDKNRIENYDGKNYSHDDNGNMKTSGTRNFSDWDNNDMLTEIGGNVDVSYNYDGLANRRQSIINGKGKKYILDVLGMSRVIMETDFSRNPENYYIYGLGLISRVKPNNSTRYYHGDFRGSTIVMTDENADITHSYQYDAFGKIIERNEEDENPYTFVGQHGVMEDLPNLYFMRARYYDPQIGRFISEDPIWAQNLYTYSNNNPTIMVDTDGRTAGFAGIIWGGITSTPAAVGDAIISGVYAYESIKALIRDDLYSAQILADKANGLAAKAQKGIVVGMTKGGLGMNPASSSLFDVSVEAASQLYNEGELDAEKLFVSAIGSLITNYASSGLTKGPYVSSFNRGSWMTNGGDLADAAVLEWTMDLIGDSINIIVGN